MLDTFEVFGSFPIPLSPRPALERWAPVSSAHRYRPVGQVAGTYGPRVIAKMIALATFESDRGQALVELAEFRQALSNQSDPASFTLARSKASP